ncbi:diaminobutyrate acetyltransferase [Geomicrobium sp. JCM 19055]|uniref:diaminobutyrate acetyltransferase n=1 Tax=Geomicrobium sp. JCM 19055 TaxID=1460649 RepID=UPI000AF6E69B
MAVTPITEKEALVFTKPSVEDGAEMWELAKKLGLDLNSSYKYLMMAEYFAETCVVVKEDDELVGFVTAFILPERQDTVFVWQVGVDESQRGRGLASRMLNEVLERNSCGKVKYLEATVTPSNDASQKLFRRLAVKTILLVTCRNASPKICSLEKAMKLNYRLRSAHFYVNKKTFFILERSTSITCLSMS